MVIIEVNGIWSNKKKKKKEQSAANNQTPHTNRHHHFSAEWTIMTVSDQIEYVD